MQKNDTQKARIAVLVSGSGTNLQALFNAQECGELFSGEITLVISNRADAYALERARTAGVPPATVIKGKDTSQERFEDELIKLLNDNQTDLVVLAGFMSILSGYFISRYPGKIINVHPSLIPSFCGKGYYGLRVHKAALDYGVKVTGATVHYVNEVVDGGKIIMQKHVNVCDGDTPKTLQRRVMEEAEWIILPLAVEQVSAQIINEKHSELQSDKKIDSTKLN